MGKKKSKNNKNYKSRTKKSSGKRANNSNSKALVRKKDVKMKFKYKHPKLAMTLKIFLIIFILLAVIGAGIVAGLMFGLWGDDLNINMNELVLSDNSVIIDSEGNILAELSGDENRKIITLDEMSPYLPKAYMAIEDERFKTHHGVDIKRTGAAILSFVTNGGKSTAGGGSTITQQLVKNITKEDDKTGLAGVTRKVKEWFRAYQVEDDLSKDQILELYLNLIFVGGKENRGVEIGSEYYFNKSAKDLSIAQCAFLAGINHSPNKYNPYEKNKPVPIEKITKRTKTVLGQMKKLGYITQEEYDTAIAEVDAGFKFENGAKGNVYSSHTDALIIQLINQIMEEKQISKNAAQTYLYSSGLKIYSTQVTSIQAVMEEEAKKDKYKLKSKENTNEDGTPALAQGAMVIVEPSTGYVVGCIGQLGEKTTSRGLNRAIGPTAISSGTIRSAGSSFKPVADLIPGIEEGLVTPATIYEDSYTVFTVGEDKYDPKNYNKFKGPITVRSATTTSQNVPFVKIMAEVGNEKCVEYLKKMGISTLNEEKDVGLSLAIGGLTDGVSVLEMAGAYATIANDGTYIEPTFYSKVEDSDGKVVLEPNQKTETAFSAETAYVVKDLLKSVVKDSGGTASYCAIKGIDVGAKTGTTNNDFDRWLCGFTNYYAGAAWYGFDIHEDVNFSGNPAGKLWAGVMSEIHEGLEDSTFVQPEGVISAKVCRTSGRLATQKCSSTYTEIFVKDKLPEYCDAHKGQYTICKDSGKLPNEFCPEDKKEVKNTGYVIEKERLGLWDTPNVKTTTTKAPKDYCTIHKKEEIVVKPEEPEKPKQEPDKETEQTPEEKPDNNTQQKPNNNTEQKPEETTPTTSESNQTNSEKNNTTNNSGNTRSINTKNQ